MICCRYITVNTLHEGDDENNDDDDDDGDDDDDDDNDGDGDNKSCVNWRSGTHCYGLFRPTSALLQEEF